MDTTVDSGAAGAAPQADVFEAPLEFPVQPYEIDEPLEIAGESDTDPEIERLRQELAETESELERIQAEEAQRQYSPAESLSEGDLGSPGGEIAAITPQQTETTRVPDEPGPRAKVADLPGKPSESSIYFGYDQATLEQQYETVLIAHARFMISNPQLTAEIQGNCDERGSREYNIALGQQRALSVKRALELLGVEGHRIETVSFGAEKPVAFGHDEDSWRLNRRADIVYY
jgi:peptidoglycan-associated lipoprotein